MNFGSLDFGTWRLVGVGLLGLGSVAAVVAIVAIIATFRGGSTDDGDPDDDEADEETDAEGTDDQFGDDVRHDQIVQIVPSPDWYQRAEVIGDEPVEPTPVEPPRIVLPQRSVAPVRQESQRPPAEPNPVEPTPDVPERPSRHGLSSGEPMAEPVSGRRRRADPVDDEPVEVEPIAPELPSRHGRRRAVDPDDAANSGAVEVAPAARREPNAPVADWYEDPDGSGGERWWDGTGWTRHRRPRSQPSPPPSRPAGWYRDSSSEGGRRFWDGSRWTDQG